MTLRESTLTVLVTLAMTVVCGAQTEPVLEPATPAILIAFQSHDIVMVGESHGNKQEYDWLRSLIATAAFADRVDETIGKISGLPRFTEDPFSDPTPCHSADQRPITRRL